MNGKIFNVTEVGIRERLDAIATMPETYVISVRRNPELCQNCEQPWPVYRHRMFKGAGLEWLRTYCACGYAQYPNLRRWNALFWVRSRISWLRLCWRKRRWYPHRAYFP